MKSVKEKDNRKAMIYGNNVPKEPESKKRKEKRRECERKSERGSLIPQRRTLAVKANRGS